jgi:hypothetical protein
MVYRQSVKLFTRRFHARSNSPQLPVSKIGHDTTRRTTLQWCSGPQLLKTTDTINLEQHVMRQLLCEQGKIHLKKIKEERNWAKADRSLTIRETLLGKS